MVNIDGETSFLGKALIEKPVVTLSSEYMPHTDDIIIITTHFMISINSHPFT